jgi:hypothetical protein
VILGGSPPDSKKSFDLTADECEDVRMLPIEPEIDGKRDKISIRN